MANTFICYFIVLLGLAAAAASNGTSRTAIAQHRHQNRHGHGPVAPSKPAASPGWYATWPLARTIGLRILYPGVMLSTELKGPLQADRSRQIHDLHGVRNLLRAQNGLLVDTMFFNRRGGGDSGSQNHNGNGNTLVICFEGNAGYYENGILQSPYAMGYSVLGWNHPGFGESTGLPYAGNEMAAADAVFEYATAGLGFHGHQIVLYAWSIGGFTASYLAGRSPGIKKLILDGTFDDILPLAMAKVPKLVSGIVATTLHHHFPLQLDKLLHSYDGPLVVIRRVDDEVVTTAKERSPSRVAPLEHNRSTHLLRAILQQRCGTLLASSPYVQNELREWLVQSHEESEAKVVEIPKTAAAAAARLSDEDKAEIVIKIADALLLDHKATHSTPLPGDVFEEAMRKGLKIRSGLGSGAGKGRRRKAGKVIKQQRRNQNLSHHLARHRRRKEESPASKLGVHDFS